MIAAAAAILTAVSMTAYGESAGFSGAEKYITAAQTPHESKYTKIQWGGAQQWEHCGVPAAYGEVLLLPAADSLIQLNEATGEQVGSVQLPDSCSTEYSGALCGSSLLLPTENGACLVNTAGLSVTAYRAFDGKTASDCAVLDGLGYFAAEADGGYQFLCIDLESEGLDTVWSFDVPEKPSGAAVQGNSIIFAAGSSIYTHDVRSDRAFEIPVGKKIVGEPFASEYAVFFSTEDGYAGKLRLQSDGTMEEDTLAFCEIGKTPSSPVAWNGRLYIGCENAFYILDSLNMETTYIISDIKGGCTPQIHYGSGPYIYTVAPREGRWALYCVLDMDEESEPTVNILAQMDDFTGGAFCASQKGTLYFRDAIGRVYALTAAPFDVLGLVLRLIVLLALLVLVFVWIKKVAKRREGLRPKY